MHLIRSVRLLALGSVVVLLGATSCADHTLSVLIGVEAAGIDLDERLTTLENSICMVGIHEDCAVLAAVAGAPYSRSTGPTEGQPRLPLTFPAVLDVEALDRTIDVQAWAESMQTNRGALIGAHRLPIGELGLAGVDPELLLDRARIEFGALVRTDTSTLVLPAFDVVIGAPAGEATFAAFSNANANNDADDADDADDTDDANEEEPPSDDIIIEEPTEPSTEPPSEPPAAEPATTPEAGDDRLLVARSTAFDESGRAEFEFGNGALARLAWALTTPGAYVELVPTAGQHPRLAGATASTLQRPTGALGVRFELALQLPVRVISDADL